MRRMPAAFAACCLLALSARAATPDDPPPYGDLVAAAGREGMVRVYSSTDVPQMADLLAEFRALYPGVALDYVKHGSAEQYGLLMSEVAEGHGSADLLLSSGMDLQIKAVNDGYAQSYSSPEADHLQPWMRWRDTAYGVTAEPIAIVYNKNLVPPEDVPHSHADLTKLLTGKPERYFGKVATYDLDRSATGVLLATQDVRMTEKTWDLFRAMGHSGVKVYSTASGMLDRVAAGDQLIGYNVIGSYALDRLKAEPALGVVLPEDYTLVLSRIAFVPKAALHPNAGKLFLNFLLSRRGQKLLATHYLGTVRDDLPEVAAIQPRSPSLRPILVGPELLTYLDQAKGTKFLKAWRRALDGG